MKSCHDILPHLSFCHATHAFQQWCTRDLVTSESHLGILSTRATPKTILPRLRVFSIFGGEERNCFAISFDQGSKKLARRETNRVEATETRACLYINWGYNVCQRGLWVLRRRTSSAVTPIYTNQENLKVKKPVCHLRK